ncbi:unnamed protein product [Sphagnum balticum]
MPNRKVGTPKANVLHPTVGPPSIPKSSSNRDLKKSLGVNVSTSFKAFSGAEAAHTSLPAVNPQVRYAGAVDKPDRVGERTRKGYCHKFPIPKRYTPTDL